LFGNIHKYAKRSRQNGASAVAIDVSNVCSWLINWNRTSYYNSGWWKTPSASALSTYYFNIYLFTHLLGLLER